MRQHEVPQINPQENTGGGNTSDSRIFDYDDPDDVAAGNSDEFRVFDWDGSEDDIGAIQHEDQSASRPKSLNRRLGSLLLFELGALSITWVVSQAPWNGFVADVIAAVWTGVAFLTLATLGLFSCAEYLSIKRIRRIEACRWEARCIGVEGDPQARWRFLHAVSRAYPKNTLFKRNVDEKVRSTAVTDAQLQAWLEHEALADQDARCRNLIKRRGMETGALVALSFNARLDMLLALWRTMALIFAIADIYDVKGGLLSKAKILRSVLTSLAFVGITQYIANAGALKTGAGIVEWGAKWAKFDHATQAAIQGVGAGLLTARVGAGAMRVSRPVELPDSQYRKMLLAVAKGVRNRAPNAEKADRERASER